MKADHTNEFVFNTEAGSSLMTAKVAGPGVVSLFDETVSFPAPPSGGAFSHKRFTNMLSMGSTYPVDGVDTLGLMPENKVMVFVMGNNRNCCCC